MSESCLRDVNMYAGPPLNFATLTRVCLDLFGVFLPLRECFAVLPLRYHTDSGDIDLFDEGPNNIGG